MKIKFSVGQAALEAAQDMAPIIDDLAVEGPFVVIDFGSEDAVDQQMRLAAIEARIRESALQTPPGPQQRALAALVSAVASQEKVLLRASSVSNDTHAVSDFPVSNQESHSLPTGDATTSNASQQSDETQIEENEDGQAPQEQIEELEAGSGDRGKRRRRNRD